MNSEVLTDRTFIRRHDGVWRKMGVTYFGLLFLGAGLTFAQHQYVAAVFLRSCFGHMTL